MVAIRSVPISPLLDTEFDKAFEILRDLVDLSEADQRMPLGPAAVYTASVVLWMLVYQRLSPKASLETAVKHFLDSNPQIANKRILEKTLSTKSGSYSEGRKRLTLEVAEWFAEKVSTSIIDASPPVYEGKRVFMIDGTTITLAPVPALQKAYPPASNKHGEGVWPVALLLVAHELASGAALMPEIGAMYGENAISETALVQKCIERLPIASIVMSDINFGIFSVAYDAQNAGHDFLLRMNKQRFNALRKHATLVNKGDQWRTYEYCWTPSAKNRKSHPDLPQEAFLNVRLHEIDVSQNLTLWLVTGLPSSAHDLASLYKKRGDVEIDIRNLKVVLDTENIRARSVAMFQKELMTSMVAYNLVIQFRRQAAELANLPARRMSFTGTWNTFRQFLMNSVHTDPAIWRERYRIALHYATKDKLPNRPGRSFKREAYQRRPKSYQFEKRKKRPPIPSDEDTK